MKGAGLLEIGENQSAMLEHAKKLPRRPGVYFMRDAAGQVIYVGKAKDLRERVKTYFAGGDGRAQIEFLIRRTRRIETIITGSENQAFILERDLIAKYKPRYNIRLKDDRAYLNIRIDKDAPWPRLELVRRVEQDGALYFGPYSFSYELRSLLEVVRRVVPLRTCSDTVFYNRQRPCLEHQIKRCAGPCCLPVARGDYMEWVRQAAAILEGKTDRLVKELNHQMEQCAEDLRFEEAALLRDRIQALESAKANQALVSVSAADLDVFALYREETMAALTILRMRSGHICDSASFSFANVQVTDEEIVEAAISQFYEGGREIPGELILPCAVKNSSLICAVLAEKRGAGVEAVVPQRGLKFRLLNLARLNAQEHFSAYFEAEARGMQTAKEIARLLNLRQVPRRIECLDISNLQGSDIVGAVAVFYDGAPERRSYKKYIISFQDKPDDFAAVHEVVYRRLKRGVQAGDLPDLLIIDGGAGQLKKALEAREALKLNVEIVALAKMRRVRHKRALEVGEGDLGGKPERVYLERAVEPVCLDGTQSATRFLQRIRDEAHRFVISFHRQRRGARVFESVLDDLPGLGPARRKRLLKTYHTLKNIRQQAPQDLARTARMPVPIARALLDKLAADTVPDT